MAERWLDQYREEILELYQQGRLPQNKVIEILEKRHTIEIPPSTFSRYLRSLPEATQMPARGEPRVTAEEEHFLSQADVFSWVRSAIEGLETTVAQVHGRMGVLEDAEAKRHKAVVDAFRGMPEAVASAMPRPTGGPVLAQPMPMRQYAPVAHRRYFPRLGFRGRLGRILNPLIRMLIVYAFISAGLWYFYRPQMITFLLEHPSPLEKPVTPAPPARRR
jgi:hypothetical protein